jgi:hypothetical protein
MKTIGTALGSCALVLAVVGCKDDDKPTQEKIAVRLESSIDTRVANDAWEAADRVGFFMVGGGTVVPGADNVELTPSGNSLTFASPVYYPETGNVDLVAYYPRTAGTTYAGGLAVTAGDQSASLASEVLYAKRADQAASATAVAMQFAYALARLEITVDVQDPGITLGDLTLSLEDAKTAGTLNLSTGALTASGNSDVVKLYKKSVTDRTVIFEALVVPQNADGMSFVASAGGVDYSEEVSAGTDFVAGATYTKTLTILVPPVADYIEVNGVKWAKANLSATGTFAATAYTEGGLFYPSDGSDPGTANPYTSYASDPCPAGWHIATHTEWHSLFITGTTDRNNKKQYDAHWVWTPTTTNPTLSADSWETVLTFYEGNYRTTAGSNMIALNTPESWSPPGWQDWGDNWAGRVRCVKE